MLIIGYKGKVDWDKVKIAFKRCTDLSAAEISATVAKIKQGQTLNVADDLVLREELKDLGILLR